MARKKVTIEDIQDTFEAARDHLGDDATLMPKGSDEGQVVLTHAGKAEVYSASALKGHLEFLMANSEPRAY